MPVMRSPAMTTICVASKNWRKSSDWKAHDTETAAPGAGAMIAELGHYALVLALAFAALTICYVTSDFSVANVYENSYSQMPLIYKFTSVWGNHEGSMLLWV